MLNTISISATHVRNKYQTVTHKIYRKLNARNVELVTPNDDNEVVGVIFADGVKFHKWLGPINRTEGKKRGRPCRVLLSRVDGYDLKPGEFGHGVWTEQGVYVIADVAIITEAE